VRDRRDQILRDQNRAALRHFDLLQTLLGPAGEGSNAAESADGEQRAAVAEGAADEASAEDVENPEGEQCPT
jgi:hypothetical protein